MQVAMKKQSQREQVQQLMEANPGISAQEIADKVGISRDAVYTLQYKIRQNKPKKKPGRPKKVVANNPHTQSEAEVKDLRTRYNEAMSRITDLTAGLSNFRENYFERSFELEQAKYIIRYLEEKIEKLILEKSLLKETHDEENSSPGY